MGLLRPEQHFSCAGFNPCEAVSLRTGSFTVSVITVILCEAAPLGLWVSPPSNHSYFIVTPSPHGLRGCCLRLSGSCHHDTMRGNAGQHGGRWKLGTKLGTIRNAPALCFSVCIASVLSFLLSWAQTTRGKYEKQLVNTDQTRRDRFGYLLSSRDEFCFRKWVKFTEETNKCRRRYYECWVQLCSPWKL